MTTDDITKAFAILSAHYGVRFQTPGDLDELRFMIAVWVDALDDIPSAVGMAAFKRHCQTETEPPTPAHIRSLAVPQGLPTPAEAWQEAMSAAVREGYCDGDVPLMSHPEIEAAARAVNWHAICFAESDRDLSFTRSAFMRCYEDFCKRTAREESRRAIEGRVPKNLLPKMKRIGK